ncbi:ABC transporter ATP-binding protein [Pollutimonas nitritireducens]|uniref:ABC transporter ATP-binding protein n=1 Tax=Pollutimonas nitritireducens TaxID=2045209 RepID=A0A2N4UG11_9BURK|nr:ABC transporter ATP-binding protein [Pollutimonas nitritireducens]PLC53958.1 ABC transporter ATP-binding protein [Pollutimonas nitritireducens]
MLRAENVSVRFGGLRAVDDLSFQTQTDQILCIIGPNGAGKTTLFSVLSGFLKPTEGRVRFNDLDVSAMRADRVALAGIARTFQIVKPFRDMTVLDNVMVGAYAHATSYKEARAHALSIIDEVDLHRKRDFLASYLTLPDLKRLEVARALATRPTYLLLDEVMAGLNLREQHEVADMIEKVHQRGVGVLLVEHSLAIVQRLGQHVLCMDSGRLIAEGTAADVIQCEAVQVAYMGIVNA